MKILAQQSRNQKNLESENNHGFHGSIFAPLRRDMWSRMKETTEATEARRMMRGTTGRYFTIASLGNRFLPARAAEPAEIYHRSDNLLLRVLFKQR